MDLEGQIFQALLELGKSRTSQAVWLNLLNALNEQLKETPAADIERLRRYKLEAAEQLAARNDMLPTLREQQRELRRMVDLYLKGKNLAVVAERLKERLEGYQYVLTVQPLPGKEEKTGKKTRLVKLQWLPILQPGQLSPFPFLAFGELLESGEADRLGQCQKCERYFRADRPTIQQFCSPSCRTAAIEERRQKGNPEQYRARKRKEVEKWRQRKKQ
jgi:hypothetical protein